MKNISDAISSFLVIIILIMLSGLLIAPFHVAIFLVGVSLLIFLIATVFFFRIKASTKTMPQQKRSRLERLAVAMFLATVVCLVALLFNSEIGVWKPFPLKWAGDGKFILNSSGRQ